MLRHPIQVASIRSHVDVPDAAGTGRPLFSRDCPVYQLRLPDSIDLWGTPTNKNPPQDWTAFPEITESIHAASGHAAVWIDLNLQGIRPAARFAESATAGNGPFPAVTAIVHWL